MICELKGISMKRFLLMVSLILPLGANAGTFQDGLVRCIASNTSDTDQIKLIEWIVYAYAQHPAFSEKITIESSSIVESQVAMAELVERLFLEDCLVEANQTFRYEGEQAVIESFKLFGTFAGRTAMSNQSVIDAVNAYADYIDEEEFERRVFAQ